MRGGELMTVFVESGLRSREIWIRKKDTKILLDGSRLAQQEIS